MRNLKKVIIVVSFILPAIIGFIGCLWKGLTVPDSAYMAIRMYLFDAEAYGNNFLFEIARWTAPVFTISGLVMILKAAFGKLKDFFVGFYSDAVAIYGDAELKEIATKNIHHAISVDDNEVMDVRRHVIMFSTDEKSLEFYKKNKDKFNGEVFIKIDKNDVFSVYLDNVKFFNPCEIISRKFWQIRDIRRVIKENEMKIAIVGSDILSRKILTYGLLNNIYSVSQKIEYHIWSNDDFFQKTHSDFNTMNADTIIYHDNNCPDRLSLIASADRIIITEKADNEFIAELSKITKAEIYCFDPLGTFVNIFDNANIHPFGCYSEILTKENIRADNLYSFAKLLNHKYALAYLSADAKKEPTVDEAWDELNGFLKGSNIASTDYHHIMLIVMSETGKTEPDYELAELEHIRWCRYHFINHWKYGKPEKGAKDPEKRIHSCLVPFDELSEVNKKKDLDGISTLLSLDGFSN